VYTNVVYVGRVHRVGCKSKNNNFCNFFGKKLEEITIELLVSEVILIKDRAFGQKKRDNYRTSEKQTSVKVLFPLYGQ